MVLVLGPASTHPLMLPSKARTQGRGPQEGVMLLTSQLLLHAGWWLHTAPAGHSAFVQDPVHSQDVHLGLLDGPGPRSGSVLEPL